MESALKLIMQISSSLCHRKNNKKNWEQQLFILFLFEYVYYDKYVCISSDIRYVINYVNYLTFKPENLFRLKKVKQLKTWMSFTFTNENKTNKII